MLALAALVAVPRDADAYSVLSHESNIDAVWDTAIRPLLVKRFPRATPEELVKARAYAYGGSVIQDLGYYPFGSHFFSNLVHYVRTGDFVEALIHEAHGVDEYAFALGALAHYAADNIGHPEGVNRAVVLMYPKLRARYGDTVTYADSPTTHVVVEFSFDVVQVATGKYVSGAYQSFIGFEVAKPVLERAFLATYALEMKDLFLDEDLAIGTYRYAVSQTIPEVTRIAWRDKREEIEKVMPGVHEDTFVYTMTRRDYERLHGSTYRRPGLVARFIAFVYRLLPKVGPLKKFEFRAPTPDAEALFVESIRDTRDRYRRSLDALGVAARLNLANTDLDTGAPSAYGEYRLADDTYAQLLDKLAKRKGSGVPDALRRHIAAFYAAAPKWAASKKERKRLAKIREGLAALQALQNQP